MISNVIDSCGVFLRLGLLLGSAEWQDPGRDYLTRNATEFQTHGAQQEMVAAASRALLAKFGSWDAEALQQPQELPGQVRKSHSWSEMEGHAQEWLHIIGSNWQ